MTSTTSASIAGRIGAQGSVPSARARSPTSQSPASAATAEGVEVSPPGASASRRATSSLSVAGTGSGSPGATGSGRRSSARPSSSTKNGFPPDASTTWSNVGRVNASPSRSHRSACTACASSPPSRSRVSRGRLERRPEGERAPVRVGAHRDKDGHGLAPQPAERELSTAREEGPASGRRRARRARALRARAPGGRRGSPRRPRAAEAARPPARRAAMPPRARAAAGAAAGEHVDDAQLEQVGERRRARAPPPPPRVAPRARGRHRRRRRRRFARESSCRSRPRLRAERRRQGRPRREESAEVRQLVLPSEDGPHVVA